jgi:hypothetical protein
MDARWHRHTHLISEALGGVLILTGLLTLFIGTAAVSIQRSRLTLAA